jgi:hypothetical protein
MELWRFLMVIDVSKIDVFVTFCGGFAAVGFLYYVDVLCDGETRWKRGRREVKRGRKASGAFCVGCKFGRGKCPKYTGDFGQILGEKSGNARQMQYNFA